MFLLLLMVLTVTFLDGRDNFWLLFFLAQCHLIKRASFSSSARACALADTYRLFLLRACDQKQKCHQTAGEPERRKETKKKAQDAERPGSEFVFNLHAGGCEKNCTCVCESACAAPSITSHREIKPSIFCHKPIQYLSGRHFFPRLRPASV